MTRSILRFCNGFITFLVAAALLLCAAYAGYALWDNQQVYNAVENVMGELRDIRAQMESHPIQAKGISSLIDAPPAEEEQAAAVPEEAAAEPVDDSPFGQLKAINPDITAWITMPGTAIDYPVMQGKTNMTYINKDVYKQFAMAGSIYLDSRNNREYQDVYSLLYGHNMSKHRMFSDVNLYKDEEFFNENHLGMLMMEDGGHLLQSLSCILTSAGNSGIFNPDNWTNSTNEQRLAMALEDAVHVNQQTLEILQAKMEAGEPFHVVALSTCSGEFTDARTILLTLMDP